MEIPSLNLEHNKQQVDFAFRTMEEIAATRIEGSVRDLPHRHNFYTILWARCATGFHVVDYTNYAIAPQKVFFVSPGQVHQVLTDYQASGYVIMFTPAFLNENHISAQFFHTMGLFSDSYSIPPITIPQTQEGELLSLTLKLQSVFNSSEAYRNEMLGAYLKLFIIECSKHVEVKRNQLPPNDQSGKQIVSEFKTLLEEKFAQWHKVGEYADALFISADYLNTVLKSAIGKTAKEYIQQRIIIEAKRKGVHTNLSSKEIAFSLGFADPSHFSRFFKKEEGISFSSFRKSLGLF